DRSDFATLAKVDDFYLAGGRQQDVVRLDVTMHVSHGVHRLQPLRRLNKDIEHLHHVTGQVDIERLAINVLHDHGGFVDLQQHALLDLQIVSAAQVWVSELTGNLEFDLHLLDET